MTNPAMRGLIHQMVSVVAGLFRCRAFRFFRSRHWAYGGAAIISRSGSSIVIVTVSTPGIVVAPPSVVSVPVATVWPVIGAAITATAI